MLAMESADGRPRPRRTVPAPARAAFLDDFFFLRLAICENFLSLLMMGGAQRNGPVRRSDAARDRPNIATEDIVVTNIQMLDGLSTESNIGSEWANAS